MDFPEFIPAEVPLAGDRFVWEGTLFHIGQLEGATRLMAKFGDINSCGCFCLASGLALWGAARFSHLMDVTSLGHVSDAALAFMCQPREVNYTPILEEKVPEEPKVLSAFRKVRWLSLVCAAPGRWADNKVPPMRDLYHLAHLLRHLLDKAHRPAFDLWLDDACRNIRHLAPRPREGLTRLDSDEPTAEEIRAYVAPYWGLPVPRKALAATLTPSEAAARFREEIAAIDWAANPYVTRAPDPDHAYGVLR